MYRRRYVQLLGIGGTASVAGCSERASDPTPNQPSVADMTLATATTVEDSGLLGELLSGFQTSFETTVNRSSGGLVPHSVLPETATVMLSSSTPGR